MRFQSVPKQNIREKKTIENKIVTKSKVILHNVGLMYDTFFCIYALNTLLIILVAFRLF